MELIKGMGDKIDYNKLNGETNAALTVTKEGGSKEYFTHCIKLLNDFKMMKDVIIQSDVRDVPILIKVAQNNLTKSAIAISDTMIKESQVDFNSKNVQIFIEKTISLITSVETADYLFGKMIDSTELRKYISVRTTNLVIKRSDKLLKLIKTTNFEDKAKLNIIIDNLNLCNKLLQYCWDISPSNIKALQQINKIIDKMIYHKLKLCLDNYNIEILNQMIENNKEKIEKAINGTNNKTTTSTSK